jgi:hypothetical protein
LTPFALYAGFISLWTGPINAFWAKILFPYTMLSASLLGKIFVPFILLAIVQFPLYGTILAFAGERKKFGLTALGLAVVHGLATALCLSAVNEIF